MAAAGAEAEGAAATTDEGGAPAVVVPPAAVREHINSLAVLSMPYQLAYSNRAQGVTPLHVRNYPMQQ